MGTLPTLNLKNSFKEIQRKGLVQNQNPFSHSLLFFLTFPTWRGISGCCFPRHRNSGGERGRREGVSRIVIHVTFRQIRGLRVLWVSDLPSKPSFSRSPSFHSAFTPRLPTFAPARIVTPPPPHDPLSLHTVLGWGDAILFPARDAGEGEGGKSQIYSLRMHPALNAHHCYFQKCKSVPAKIAVCFHRGWQRG